MAPWFMVNAQRVNVQRVQMEVMTAPWFFMNAQRLQMAICDCSLQLSPT